MQGIDNNRLLNMKLKLVDYNFDVKWQAGKVHFLADLLSRSPAFAPREEEGDVAVINEVVCQTLDDPNLKEFSKKAMADAEYTLIKNALQNDDHPSDLGPSHPAKDFAAIWDELSIEGGLIILRDKLVVPKTLQKEILGYLHLAHQGLRKTIREARNLYYWPNQKVDVTNMVQQCRECQKFQPSQQSQPLIQTFAETALEKVSTDLFQLEGGGTFHGSSRSLQWLPICCSNEHYHNKRRNNQIGKLV